jgi:hypothetical protein
MKKSIGGIAFTAVLVAVLGASRAQAQIVEPLKFTTTFSFMAGPTLFPAGSYTIRPLGDGTDVVEIANVNGTSTKFFTVFAAGVRDPYRTPDEVTFTKQGDTYVLSQVWDAAEREGVQTMTVKEQEPHPHRHHA